MVAAMLGDLGSALRRAAFFALCAALPALADAQASLPDEVHTVAAADTGVPVEESFTISTAGTYKVTLTDLGAALTPSAPLASVKLGITSGDQLVGQPLTGAGTLQFSATPGTYVLQVVGKPGTVAGSGPFGLLVAAMDGTQIAAFSDDIALPPQALPGTEAVLDDSFTVPANGNYQLALNDLAFPQALPVLTLALTVQGGGLLTTLPASSLYTATVSLQAGITYRLFAVGQVSASGESGLYSATVIPQAGGAPVYSKTLPVGATTLIGSPGLLAGSDTLQLTDLAFPAALAQVGTAIVLNGQIAAQLAATGNQAFTATANTYDIFGIATPAGGGAGSYAVQIQSQGATPPFSVARAVTAPGGAVSAYSFDTALQASGTYSVALTDFQFPTAFMSLTLAAVQGATVLGSPVSAPGSVNVTAAAGPISLVAFAQPGNSGGLFGVDLTASGASTPAYEVTQGVGQLFSARQVNITAAGDYDVTATDVGFPANFASLSVVVTQGTQRLGSIFSSGTFRFTAAPGNYFVNFIAQPSGPDEAGTYALSVAPAPPAPTVSLKTNVSHVSSSGTVTLTWSSTNATSCTASGGWTGTKATSGTETSAAITTATTFTLSCSGPGGTTSASAQVSVDAPSGGGGALDLLTLAAISAALAAAASHTRRPRRRI